MRALPLYSLLTLLLLVSSAQAVVQRFETIARGDVAIAGNTLGLSKATGTNSPGDRDAIGTFITTNLASTDTIPASAPPWPAGTTNSWPFNASTGVLSLPAGSIVLYAELVWGGSSDYIEDVTASLDVPVGLDGPSSPCGAISPDAITASTISQLSGTGFFAVEYYMRSADVTSCIAGQGSGAYTVSGVPATQHESIDSLNAAGWTLIVAYQDDSKPLRDLRVVTDGRFVEELDASSFTVEGLSTPPNGEVTGRIVAAALEGDATSSGDQLRIRPAGGSFTALSGAGNPASNFFASQINDADGNLETGGSFGTSNHEPFIGLNANGARQGFDTTGVLLSSTAAQLANDQSAADVEASTSGDSFVAFGYGLAIDRAATGVPALPLGSLGLLAVTLGATGACLLRVRARRPDRDAISDPA